MTWGVATALLEQRGSEGLFEVDEAWLPKVAAQLDPALIVLGNLFRDQLDRYGETEALADDWAKTVAARAGRTRFVLNADDPLIADLGRDDGGQPPRGRRLLRHRRRLARRCPSCSTPSTPSTAAAAATPTPTSAPSSATSATTPAPTAAPSGPRPDVAATEIELHGMEGSTVDAAHARRASCGSSSPSPASTTSTTRSPRSPPRSSWASRRSGSPPPWPRCAPPSAGSRRSRSAASRVSILLIKNPAGANEVLRTLRLEAERAAASTSGSRLNDRIADGRDVSWIWDADFELLEGAVRRVACAGTRAAEMALRLKYAGWPEERDRGRARDRAPRSTRAVAEAPGQPLRPAHLHGAARAAQAARRPRPGRGVLAMSAARERRSGTTSSAAATPPTCLWEELAGAGGRAGPRARLRHRPRRPAPRPPRARDVIGLDRDAELLAALRERAAELPVATPVARRPRLRRSTRRFGAGAGADAAAAAARRRRASASPACAASPPHLRPGGARRGRDPRGDAARPTSAPPPLPDVREVDGWVYSSLPVEAAVGAGRRSSSTACARPSPPTAS